MKTQNAIDKAGSATALAQILGITGSAITQWGDTIPPLRIYELKELRPKWFKVDKKAVVIEPAPKLTTISSAYPSRADYMKDVTAGLVIDERKTTRRVSSV